MDYNAKNSIGSVMKLKIIACVFFILLGALPSKAQSFWSRTYGGANDDNAMSVVETPDTGYLVVGYTGSFGNGASDAFLLKTDSIGQYQWQKTYGAANIDVVEKIIACPSGGYLLAGYSNSYTLDYDAWVLKVDDLGDTLWTRKIGQEDWDRIYSATNAGYGEYILAGESYSGNNQYEDGYLIKLNDNGDTLWTQLFSLSGNESFKDIIKISETRYAVVGTTENIQTQERDGFLLLFDSNGNHLDTIFYDYGYKEFLNAMAMDPTNNSLMLGGYYYYDTTNFSKSIQIKVDSTGNEIFHVLAPTADDFGMHILSYGYFSSDIFFFCGRSFYKNSGDHQGVALKSFSDGYPEYMRSYGTIGPDDGLNEIIKTYDGGLLGVGFTKSFGPGTQALLLYKIASDANVSSQTLVDIQESDITEKIEVYPIPANNEIIFKAPDEFRLELIDMGGRKINSQRSSNGQLVLAVSQVQQGVYWARMLFPDGSAYVKKVYIIH